MIAICGQVLAQVKVDIQHIDVKVKHDTNCSAMHYNLHIPHVIGDSKYAEMLAMVNDSIDALVREADVPTPEVVKYWNSLIGLCDDTDLPSDNIDMTCEEGRLDAEYVSFAVITSYFAGNGGRGGVMECHTFNLDVEKNKALQWTDILTDKNRRRLHEKMQQKFQEQRSGESGDDLDVDQLKGWSATNTDFIFYYACIVQPGFEVIIPIRLPIAEVRSYFTPPYRRLLRR